MADSKCLIYNYSLPYPLSGDEGFVFSVLGQGPVDILVGIMSTEAELKSSREEVG